MERVDRIIKHPVYIENMEKNLAAEADRRFCRHNMEHFLAVSRLCWILCLENDYAISKDLVYAAGLLHDIGKHLQYSDKVPHEIASSEIAPVILKDCGYSEEESKRILSAILSHRDSKIAGERNLKGFLYRADKASRTCFDCKAIEDCNWKEGKQNFSVF